MKERFRIREFDIGQEVQELYWIAGTKFNEASDCFIRPVLKSVESGEFRMCNTPIGLLPILTLGRHYHRGYLLELPTNGLLDSVVLGDLSEYQEITSADLPSSLYSFDDNIAGHQRLLRYEAHGIEIYIPTIEMIRYLFLHNKTLANALMRPDGLMTLFRPLIPGFREEMRIDFEPEMPVSSLSNDFVKEFTWLALDEGGRHSWDSVRNLSLSHGYMTFTPPPIVHSTLEFRGVFDRNSVLVLELMKVTGRTLPSDKLIYSHPSLKRVKWIGDVHGPSGQDAEGNGVGVSEVKEIIEYDYDIKDDGKGSTNQQAQKALNIALKSTSFDKSIPIEKIVIREERERKVKKPGKSTEEKTIIKKTITVSVGDISSDADVPPVEFCLLIPGRPEDSGDLYLLANVVKYMAALLPDRSLLTALCHLKPGKRFSVLGRHPRLAMVTSIYSKDRPPIVLLDADHSDDAALSLLAVIFNEQQPFHQIEPVIKQILDGLIDNNGHWDTALEEQLQATCKFERFPRLMTPREEDKENNRSAIKAAKLAARLGLMGYYQDGK